MIADMLTRLKEQSQYYGTKTLQETRLLVIIFIRYI